jgi:hypothetical protein
MPDTINVQAYVVYLVVCGRCAARGASSPCPPDGVLLAATPDPPTVEGQLYVRADNPRQFRVGSLYLLSLVLGPQEAIGSTDWAYVLGYDSLD